MAKMNSLAPKMPRETLRDQVDKLVTWYEKNKPNAGKRIEVNCTPKELAKEFDLLTAKDLKAMDISKLPKERIYRGRTLVAIA